MRCKTQPHYLKGEPLSAAAEETHSLCTCAPEARVHEVGGDHDAGPALAALAVYLAQRKSREEKVVEVRDGAAKGEKEVTGMIRRKNRAMQGM